MPDIVPDLAATAEAARRKPHDETRLGVLAALFTYASWGFLPLLIALIENVPATLIVAERTLYSLLLVGAILAFGRGLRRALGVLGNRRTALLLMASAGLLAVNWLLYVYAIETDRLLDASFGYFINPLVSVALGMVLLGERQSPVQGVALGIAFVGILIQALGLGGVPYIALGLAFTFALYGYVRKTVPVNSTAGLFVETLLLSPVAIGYLVVFTLDHGVGPHADPHMVLLLALTGPATALPLLAFAYAVRRMRLTTIGMFQYIAPSLQFVVAVAIFAEPLNETRLFSFMLIWFALGLFSWDSLRRHRRAVIAARG